MKFLVLSDLHANWWALEAVLKDSEGQYDQIICCGDMVGYNPHPTAVLQWTRQNCTAVIRGNHDKVVARLEDLSWFNEVAQEAARWTMDALPADEIEYLRDLPKGPLKVDSFQISHGSPRDEDEYILNAREAADSFRGLGEEVTFFGHTHVQGGFFLARGKTGTLQGVGKKHDDRLLELEPGISYLINPGSVGQPRDGDPRAAYALYDTEAKTVAYRRSLYPVDRIALEIKQAGLPDMLGYRLFRGV